MNLLYSWQKAKFYSNNFRPFSKNKKWHSLLIYKSFVICSWRINHSKTWRRCVNLFMPRIWLTVCGLAPCCVRYTTRPSTTGGTRPATWCWCLTSRTPSSTRMFPLRYGATSYATFKIKMSNGIHMFFYVHKMKYFLQFEQMPSYLRKKAFDVSLFFD